MSVSKRARTVLILIACVLFMSATTMFGQAVNGTLLGTLTDASGAVVPGAQVTITEVATGIAHSTQSNGSGNFVFPNLPPGNYDVTSEARGFKKETRAKVRLDVNSTVRVDMTMQPGAVTETVEVTAAAQTLQTDRADVTDKIETRQVSELPLSGPNRNFQSLLSLVPGTTRTHRDHSEFFNAQDTLNTEVNGQARVFNNLQIEGVDNNERTGLLQIYVPPAEAIQTVDVSTNNYAAEFGRAGGAVTNVVLKSGTNNFHGSAYEFNRVSALAARSYFNRVPGPFPRSTYNYYGGTFGGPIRKNKTFFFADILRIDDLRGRFNLFTVPTDPFRNGDFSSELSKSTPVVIYNPFTGNSDGTGRQQFVAQPARNIAKVAGPNGTSVDAFNPACTNAGGCPNVVPVDLMDPISLKLLALIPHTNLAGLNNNFQNTTQFLKNSTLFDVKLDHNRTDNDRYAFRFSRNAQHLNDPPVFGLAGGPGGSSAGFQGTGDQHVESTALENTHLFSSTLISEARFGVSHYRNIAHNADYGTTASQNVGINGVNLDKFTSGLSQINISGYSQPTLGYSASMPWDRGETNINLVNNWTKIHGNHTFKWGADFRRLRDDLVQAQTFNPRGLFTFNSGTTQLNTNGKGASSASDGIANGLAAFLIDVPTGTVGRDVSVVSGSWRETELFTFVEDQWKATSKFTVDAGLRWELYLPPTPSHAGRYSNYDPVNNDLVVAGIGGNPLNVGRTTDYHYFAPRLGLAYRISESTVLRSGFGISYEPFPDNNYAFNNFPVRQNNAFTQANSFGPALLASGQTANLAAGFPPAQIATIPSNGILPADPKQVYWTINQNFRQPYVESWNLAIGQTLPKNWILDLAYVGNHGVRIPLDYAQNAATAPSLCTAAEISGNLAGCGGKTVGAIQGNNCAVGNSTRPLCNQFGRSADTHYLFSPSTSNYDALQARLDHHFANGFLITTSYTWGKGLGYWANTAGSTGSIVNYLNFRQNYSVDETNRMHTFVQSYIYELPFGRGKRFLNSGIGGAILGGWQVSGVLSRMSGVPLHFTSSGTSLAASGTTQTPIQIAPFHVLSGIDSSLWFDPSSFCQPGVANNPGGGNVPNPNCPTVAAGVLGNMARYSFSGPGFFNLDAGIFRRIALTERMGMEFRATAFGITNTPHFGTPNVDASSNDFGHIRGLLNATDGGSRVVELSGKISF